MCGFRRLGLGGISLVVALVACEGCAAVTYQDAKMAGKGKVEVTPTVSRLGASFEGESQSLLTVPGALLTLGLSDKTDLVAGYMGLGLGLGPKFSLVQDRAALFVPVTVWPGVQVSPTAVFSVPLGNGVTFNPGVKVVWTACEDCELMVGAHVGLSVPSADGRIVLRPEVGLLKIPGTPGTMWAFGVGLSFRSR